MDHPEPIELANLNPSGHRGLGRELLEAAGHAGKWMHFVKYLWAGQWVSGLNCGHWTADQFAARYGTAVHLDDGEVTASAIYRSIGAKPEHLRTTYDDVDDTLVKLGPGTSAMLASVLKVGARKYAHMYMAVNDGGTTWLLDPFFGRRLPWPPYWGEHAVTQTVVSYVDKFGRPLRALDGSPGELGPADQIGTVRGLPENLQFWRRRPQSEP